MIDVAEIKPKIQVLAEQYNLSLVILFGSQATGKTHSQSDVDLAFLAQQNMSYMDIARMEFEFINTLKIKKIELLNLKYAYPLLLKQVALKSILLYEKNHSFFAQFKIYALKQYMESKKLLDLRLLSLNRFLQKI